MITEFPDGLGEQFGTEVATTGFLSRGNRSEAMVFYENGIPSFDQELSIDKFYDTNCLIGITSYENAVLFNLFLPNFIPLAHAYIWRNDIKNIEYKKAQVKKPKFQILKAVLPTSPVTGAIGNIISDKVKDNFLKKKEYKLTGHKIKNGIEIYLSYYDPKDKVNKKITLNVTEEDFDYSQKFFQTQWKPILSELDKKDNKCYIATVCYGNINTNEVSFLRQYRDDVLLHSTAGRLFVKLYYSISPFTVSYLSNNKEIKKITKKLLDYIVRKLSTKYPLKYFSRYDKQ